MIRINQNIRYQNVVTRKSYFHYEDMQKELVSFLNAIEAAGVNPVGPLTYALYNAPTDENVFVEFIMSVDSDDVHSDELVFQTYYSVENMASTIVFGDYETQMEVAYSALIEFLRQAELESCTPIFHVVDRDRKYIEVMIGY